MPQTEKKNPRLFAMISAGAVKVGFAAVLLGLVLPISCDTNGIDMVALLVRTPEIDTVTFASLLIAIFASAGIGLILSFAVKEIRPLAIVSGAGIVAGIAVYVLNLSQFTLQSGAFAIAGGWVAQCAGLIGMRLFSGEGGIRRRHTSDYRR